MFSRLSSPWFIALGILCLAPLLLLKFSQLPANYRGFERINWEESSRCRVARAPRGLPSRAIELHGGAMPCSSHPIKFLGEMIEFEYFVGHTHEPATLEFVNAQGETVRTQVLPRKPEHIPHWNLVRLMLDSKFIAENLSIRLSPPKKYGEVALKNKITFFHQRSLTTFFEAHNGYTTAGMYWIYFFGVVLLLPATLRTRCVLSQTLLYLLMVFPLHWQSSLYFYWDEWYIIERFSNLGIAGIHHTQNEHYVPLFFLWYYALLKVFAGCYFLHISTSLALHAYSAVLTDRLLRRISDALDWSPLAARLSSITFLLSSLHAETLQWSFEQSIILSNLCVLLSCIFVWDGIAEGGKKKFVATGFLLCAAPLFFGGGFTGIAEVGIVAVLSQLLRKHRVTWRELGTSLVLPSFGTSLAALCYWLFRVVTVRPTTGLPPLIKAIAYLFVGTQIGGVLRTFGLLSYFEPWQRDVMEWKLLLGIGISLALLIIPFLFLFQRREVFLVWSAGQILMILAFLLPAIGRAELGLAQALTSRYQYSAALGLCVVLFVAFAGVAELMKNWNEAARLLIIAVLVLSYVSVQSATLKTFHYHEGFGRENRVYIAELADWMKRVKSEREKTGSTLTDFEGRGTSIKGLYPTKPENLTPDRFAPAIYRAYQWVRQESVEQ